MDYYFDVRDDININEIENKLAKMIRQHKCESDKIINKINVITKENINIFNILIYFGEYEK